MPCDLWTVIDQAKLGVVGQVTAVNTASLQAHLGGNIGVLAPLALTTTGQWLNVNADMAATALAQKLQAENGSLFLKKQGIRKSKKLTKRLIFNKSTFKKKNKKIQKKY